MLWLYRLCFVPVFLLLLPGYARRMRRRGGYGRHLAHRFGRHDCPPRGPAPRVWLQAVSVGEMLAIGPLLRGLHGRGVEVYLTTTTSTGFHIAQERYLPLVCGLGYFPLDWWFFSRAAWNRIRPDLAVLTEGERWPEHLAQARRQRVPVICVNARLSDRSYRRLRAFPAAARLVLRGIDLLLPGSKDDAERFVALGFSPEQLRVTGNIKLDVAIEPLEPGAQQTLRAELGLPPHGHLLVGASTWPGEEAALVSALLAARAEGHACSLLLVPRHAERRESLAAELAGSGLAVHFRSRGPATRPFDVTVADTTGELQRLLQLADVVFVGKSLAPHTEGQTPVEAAALGKAILFGPGMSNFRPIAAALLVRGAALEVPDPAALRAEVCRLLAEPDARAGLAAAASAWHATNRGALDRTLAAIYGVLAATGSAGIGSAGTG